MMHYGVFVSRHLTGVRIMVKKLKIRSFSSLGAFKSSPEKLACLMAFLISVSRLFLSKKGAWS